MTERQHFGTDGIRGAANTPPMTADIALKVAMAAGHYLKQSSDRPKAVIGKDTRLSGYLLEPALTAGFISVGMDVVLLGPLPTPAVAMLTKSLGADLGVMLSASHNPYQDNGIKLFGADGYKLSDKAELEIEAIMTKDNAPLRAPPEALGRAARLDEAPDQYLDFLRYHLPENFTLNGLKIVLDCAHGAAYKVGPALLEQLGAQVIPLGVDPNGLNINDGVGVMHPAHICKAVVDHKADIGIALDGDADRLMIIDETGTTVDGDQIIALIAQQWQTTNKLNKNGVVGTLMSNLGFETFLKTLDIPLFRTKVGDRYVMEMMREKDINLGGEQSGHIILSDYATTGDGLMGALEVLISLKKSGAKTSVLTSVFQPWPQLLENIRFEGHDNPIELADVQAAIRLAENTLGEAGQLVIRKSGTEPLIRVMAQGKNAQTIKKVVNDITQSIIGCTG